MPIITGIPSGKSSDSCGDVSGEGFPAFLQQKKTPYVCPGF
jgi:hypothetical protein